MGKMCPNCGNILSDQAKFCPKCGTKQETQTRQEGKFCLFCGATLEPGARFCSSCGRDLMAAKKGNGGAVHSNVSAADYVKSGFDKVAGTLNEKIGESVLRLIGREKSREPAVELFIAVFIICPRLSGGGLSTCCGKLGHSHGIFLVNRIYHIAFQLIGSGAFHYSGKSWRSCRCLNSVDAVRRTVHQYRLGHLTAVRYGSCHSGYLQGSGSELSLTESKIRLFRRDKQLGI